MTLTFFLDDRVRSISILFEEESKIWCMDVSLDADMLRTIFSS